MDKQAARFEAELTADQLRLDAWLDAARPYGAAMEAEGFELDARRATQHYPYLAGYWPSVTVSEFMVLVFGNGPQVLALLTTTNYELPRAQRPLVCLEVREPAELTWLLGRFSSFQHAKRAALVATTVPHAPNSGGILAARYPSLPPDRVNPSAATAAAPSG